MISTSEKDVHDLNFELKVSVSRQEMDLLRDGVVVKTYPISTSRYGPGTEPGSFKTPLGRFSICEKIGEGAPESMVFESRKPTGEIAPEGSEGDKVLTRILWLDGLEEANSNTRERYIYIHGTNHEGLIGTPASHGCIRMRNSDIVELYRGIPEGAVVEIVA